MKYELYSNLFNKLTGSLVVVPQEDSSVTLQFSGTVQTRTVVAILLRSGQAGVVAPISISFYGDGGWDDISDNTIMTSDSSLSISCGNNNGQITIPQSNGNWGNDTIILLYNTLKCVKL